MRWQSELRQNQRSSVYGVQLIFTVVLAVSEVMDALAASMATESALC